jgi:hypothetical protein
LGALKLARSLVLGESPRSTTGKCHPRHPRRHRRPMSLPYLRTCAAQPRWSWRERIVLGRRLCRGAARRSWDRSRPGPRPS